MTPWEVANLDPRGMVEELMKKTTKHCYILNLLTLGLMVSEKKIFEGSLATWFNINIWPLECSQFGH